MSDLELTPQKNYKKNFFPIVIGIVFVLVFTIISVRFIFQAKKANDELIASHIAKLDNIFKRINETCQISSFMHEKDHIDFLTVKNFTGSTIGSMHLVKPENWEGPYLDNNLVIEGKEYQIVHTKHGYFILPGDGVDLANGTIIGKSFSVTQDTDIEALMKDSRFLLSGNNVLAAHIQVDNILRKPNDETIAEHIRMLSEIFRRINKTCQITGFRHQKDHIDFLNVEKFSGSVIGSMNLKNPSGWQGPYLEKNLTIENKYYQIVSTKYGYFILPDNGVDLSNGQIIGRSLIITPETNIELLMRDPKALMSNNKVLAARIDTVKTDFAKLDKGDYLSENVDIN